MSKIGNFVLEQEDCGNAIYNESDRSYDFTNQTKREHGNEGQWRTDPNDTLGLNVFQRCLRHTSPRGLYKTETPSSSECLQTLSTERNESPRTRVLYRKAIRRSRIGRSRIQ